MSRIQDIINKKERRIISTEETLKDVEPFFTEEELENLKNSDEKIEIK